MPTLKVEVPKIHI